MSTGGERRPRRISVGWLVLALFGFLVVNTVLNFPTGATVLTLALGAGSGPPPSVIPGILSVLVGLVGGLALCFARRGPRARGAGIGLLIGWGLASLVSFGYCTGLNPALYRPELLYGKEIATFSSLAPARAAELSDQAIATAIAGGGPDTVTAVESARPSGGYECKSLGDRGPETRKGDDSLISLARVYTAPGQVYDVRRRVTAALKARYPQGPAGSFVVGDGVRILDPTAGGDRLLLIEVKTPCMHGVPAALPARGVIDAQVTGVATDFFRRLGLPAPSEPPMGAVCAGGGRAVMLQQSASQARGSLDTETPPAAFTALRTAERGGNLAADPHTLALRRDGLDISIAVRAAHQDITTPVWTYDIGVVRRCP